MNISSSPFLLLEEVISIAASSSLKLMFSKIFEVKQKKKISKKINLEKLQSKSIYKQFDRIIYYTPRCKLFVSVVRRITIDVGARFAHTQWKIMKMRVAE